MEDNIIMMIECNTSGNAEITTSIGIIRVL